MKALILASGSAYRRALLSRLGLSFEAIAPDIDESVAADESPAALAARLGDSKARSIRDCAALVIGSDQVASLDGIALGKPGDHGTALRQLEACQGKTVSFYTSCAVLDQESGRIRSHLDETRVHFRRRSRPDLERYLQREPALDCAGGFKAEGLGITLFDSIESNDPTALIGLPLIWLTGVLQDLGLDPLVSEA